MKRAKSALLMIVILASICAGGFTTWTSEQLQVETELIRTLRIDYRGEAPMVRSVAFSPDGRYLASGSSDGKVRLWEVGSGREIHAFSGPTADVDVVAFSPDGKYIAGAPYVPSATVAVKLWEAASRKEVRTFTTSCKPQWSFTRASLAFSPAGEYIATGVECGEVWLWEVATGRELRTLSGHTGWVNSVAFSPDGKLLASGSGDGTVLLWDLGFLIPQPPRVLSVAVPAAPFTGVEVRGTVGFADKNADLARAEFTVLEGPLPSFTLDLTKPPYAASVQGKAEGSFEFTLKVDQPGRYRIRLTLVDAAELRSEPWEFSFEARTPTAPSITKVVFPPRIKANQEQNGLVKFEDPDGDIVKAEFEVLEGDPATIQLKPGMSFDPGVQGQTKGSFGFSVIVTKAQKVKLRLTLVDAAGLRSEPYEFTFEVE